MVEIGKTTEINEKQVTFNGNLASPGLRNSSAPDLEAARSRERPSSSSPLSLRAPPGIFHPNGSLPASVTSLPVQGIEDAPTHRRRRNRRRRNQQASGQATAAGGLEPLPRRANSMPINPALRSDVPAQPFDWLKGLDTLLTPQKKIVARPNLTQCFSEYYLYILT